MSLSAFIISKDQLLVTRPTFSVRSRMVPFDNEVKCETPTAAAAAAAKYQITRCGKTSVKVLFLFCLNN